MTSPISAFSPVPPVMVRGTTRTSGSWRYWANFKRLVVASYDRRATTCLRPLTDFLVSEHHPPTWASEASSKITRGGNNLRTCAATTRRPCELRDIYPIKFLESTLNLTKRRHVQVWSHKANNSEC